MRKVTIASGVSLALLLAGCETIVNSVQGRPVNEIATGQVSTGTLSAEVDSRITVKTVMSPGPGYKTCWSETTGAGSGTLTTSERCSYGQEMQVDNEYGRVETITGTTSIWRIDTTGLKAPASTLLIVRGQGFLPSVSLFIDVAENALGSGPSIAVPANPQRDNEVGGIITLDPRRSYLLTVQSREPMDADFQVGVMLLTRVEK